MSDITALEAYNLSVKQSLLNNPALGGDIAPTMIEIFENISDSIKFGLFQCYHKLESYITAEQIDKIIDCLENLYNYKVKVIHNIDLKSERLNVTLKISWDIKLNYKE